MAKRVEKQPKELFLMSEAGKKPSKGGGFGPNEVVYYMLSTSNGRYLHMDRLWPVLLAPGAKVVQDVTWGRWKFNKAKIGEPLELSDPRTWQRLLTAGLRLKPKKKTHPSALTWPAIKGYVDVLRVLLDAGVEAGKDDPLTAAAAFEKREATELLAKQGFDVANSIKVMERYKNEGALKILRSIKRR